MNAITAYFSNIGTFLSIFKKGCPAYLGASSSTSSYIFLMSEEKIVSFCVKNLSYWTTIERCSNNSSILQKDLLCSNCSALSILSKQFSDFPKIMLFDAFHKWCFLKNTIKDISNNFRLKKELNYAAIKRNAFRPEKEKKVIEDRIITDIRYIFGYQEENY